MMTRVLTLLTGDSGQLSCGSIFSESQKQVFFFVITKFIHDLITIFKNLGEEFDYGFKIKRKDPSCPEDEPSELPSFKFPDEAFHMITQLNWEDDDIKHKVMEKLNAKGGLASGWLPTATNRMALATRKGTPAATPVTGKAATSGAKGGAKSAAKTPGAAAAAAAAVEEAADELVFGQWEDDIIWDSENIKELPQPKILTLDTNDENVILAIPEDIDPATKRAYVQHPVKVKIPHPHVHKSKLLLGKSDAGVINVLEDDAPSENNDNDEFYAAKATEAAIKGNLSIISILIVN